MQKNNRIETNINVKKVDLSNILSDISDEKYSKLVSNFEWGFVETPNGIYVLNNEGTGVNKPIERTIDIDLHGKNDKGITFVPIKMMRISIKQFKSLPSISINLKDFIRSFGSKLDENYDKWRIFLEKEMKAA